MDKIFFQSKEILIRTMKNSDIPEICKAEDDESNSSIKYFNRQLQHQQDGKCIALLALYKGQVAGYVYFYYKCKWGGLANQGYPSIVDLSVIESFRRKGIGDMLMETAENIAASYSDLIYLDVGLNSDYGSAQRLYAKRGYIPDGKGIYYDEKSDGRSVICQIDALYKNDDALTLCLIKKLR